MNAMIYTTNTGSTEHYAKLLAQNTGLPVYSLAEAKKRVFAGAEVIYLGWIMAGSVKGYAEAAKMCRRDRQYIPETLMNTVQELDAAYEHYKHDPGFQAELTALLNDYAGRPSRLYYAGKVTEDLGGAKVYLKREDLNHTGAHKINNVLGQALLALSLIHISNWAEVNRQHTKEEMNEPQNCL